MKFHQLFLFFLSMLFFNPVVAQNCPAGIPSGGNPHCIPPDRPESPYYNGSKAYVNSAPQQPKIIQGYWADRWGAIAIDDKKGVMGVSKSQKNEKQAELVALNDCRNRGGSNCRINHNYYNQCVVVVGGEKTSRMQSSATLARAADLATKFCQSRDVGCQVLYSGCSLAEVEYPAH